MSGHKVRCQCGFVFRLGPKKDKQPGVVEDLKRRRALKERKKVTKENAFDSKPIQAKLVAADEELDLDDLIPAEEPVPREDLLKDFLPKQDKVEPVSDAPALNTPQVESSQIDSAEIEADDLGAPVLDAQIFEEPIPVAPVPEAPIPQAPVAKTPILEAPILEAPILEAPVLGVEADESIIEIYSGDLSEDIPTAPVISAASVDSNKPSRFRMAPADDDGVEEAILIEPGAPSLSADNSFDALDAMASPLPPAQTLQPRSGQLAVAAPKKKKRKRRRSANELESNTWPIISLVVAVIGLPLAVFTLYKLVSAFTGLLNLVNVMSNLSGGPAGSLILPMIVAGLMSLLSLGFVTALGISGVTSIIELVRQEKLIWAQQLLWIAALIFLVAVIFHSLFVFVNGMNSISQFSNMGNPRFNSSYASGRLVGRTIAQLLFFGFVPMVAGIVGILRCKK